MGRLARGGAMPAPSNPDRGRATAFRQEKQRSAQNEQKVARIRENTAKKYGATLEQRAMARERAARQATHKRLLARYLRAVTLRERQRVFEEIYAPFLSVGERAWATMQRAAAVDETLRQIVGLLGDRPVDRFVEAVADRADRMGLSEQRFSRLLRVSQTLLIGAVMITTIALGYGIGASTGAVLHALGMQGALAYLHYSAIIGLLVVVAVLLSGVLYAIWELWVYPLYLWVALGRQRARLKNSQTNCAVCLDDFEAVGGGPGGDGVRTLACGHAFHADCVDLWIQEKRTCPVCRIPV